MVFNEYKKFDGKTYKLSYFNPSRKEAEKQADFLRKYGFNARVVEKYDPGSGKWYIVYYRKKE